MKQTVLVLGSGPIRIGQGIEFDYSCVHCVWALQELGYRAVIVNNNPETVSTDFDTGDALYFEPVTLSDVLNIIEREKPTGVVVQFGGQTAINLAEGLHKRGVNILGTQPDAIAAAEDRERFDRLLGGMSIPRPAGRAVRRMAEALRVADDVGYPVLVRPSFVLGGRAMEIVYDEVHLMQFYEEAGQVNPDQPVLVDKYLIGQEAEVDVISDGEDTLVPGIMEHIERAGIHSGDSMAVYPPVTLSDQVQHSMVTIACDIARALKVRGLMNIQFVVKDDTAYVLEVNPRASRTVPYLSKVTEVPMVSLATQAMMGVRLRDLGFGSGLWKGGALSGGGTPRYYAVKAPVFSFQKLARVEPSLGPEMKSTGEILGIDTTYRAALYKALIASGIQFRPDGYVVITVADEDKPAAIDIARSLVEGGYPLASTGGTHDALMAAGIRSWRLNKIQEGSPNLLDAILAGEVSLMINTPQSDRREENEYAKRIRRACIESGIACVTNIETAKALADSLEVFIDPLLSSCLPYHEYVALGAQ
jgi:carbamoyl-phosphate synthase large subunit